ncbi:MAG: hypothetical protein HY866_22905, partial [Chloroflexi bacterium]|nr:hypothetical protein [Chloroflexota bacterium]
MMKKFGQRLWTGWQKRRRWQKTLIILALLVAVIGTTIYQWVFAGLPQIDALNAGMALPSTRIYDRQGRLLYQIADPNTGVNQV